MKGYEALKHLDEGKKIRRDYWSSVEYLVKIQCEENRSGPNWIIVDESDNALIDFDVDLLLSDGWEIYKDGSFLPEIKPCPFCGCEEVDFYYNPHPMISIKCVGKNCSASFEEENEYGAFFAQKALITRWNRRNG